VLALLAHPRTPRRTAVGLRLAPVATATVVPAAVAAVAVATVPVLAGRALVTRGRIGTAVRPPLFVGVVLVAIPIHHRRKPRWRTSILGDRKPFVSRPASRGAP